jgi:hypothetical protein
MPKTKTMKKRIYTYEQLNSILRKRGEPDKYKSIEAPLYGRLMAVWGRGDHHFTLSYNAMSYATVIPSRISTAIASVHSVAGGDTVYWIPQLEERVRKSRPKLVAQWRRHVERFTPHVCDGKSDGLYEAWYRLHDGSVSPITTVQSVVGGVPVPRNRSLLYPSFSRPSLKEWAVTIEPLPKFVARAKRFVVNLKAALPEGIKADVQLLGRSLATSDGTLCLHVCLPPTEQAQSKRLVIATRPHDKESRTHFNVDGDYGIRHSQFDARLHGDLRVTFRWPCAKDAIVGIKEWVMGSIYIPGL